jgi:List-Bact-rpt repeat protein
MLRPLTRLLPLIVLVALALPATAHTAVAPVTWCGKDEVTANRVPDLEVSSTSQIRFIYAIPSDGTDNFFAFASGIATDAASIDQWWRGQDPTRTPRFDRYPFPNCSSTFGGLDIGFVRLPNTSAYYAEQDTPGQRLDADLTQFPSTQKTLVYYDGPIKSQEVCGETGFRAAVDGGRFGLAFVYLRSACDATPPGRTSGVIAAHELIHNLGALPNGAPHPCPGDAGHPCDSSADILWPFLSIGTTLDGKILDVNRDDYYGHSGTWFDLQDSLWLEHLPQHRVSLAVSGGSGSVTATIGSTRRDCGKACDLQVDDALQIRVDPIPADGFVFDHWTGVCAAGTVGCTLTATADQRAEAFFVRKPVQLSVRVAGRGRVTSLPAAISCPSRCAAKVGYASRVRLVAHPRTGWRFTGWSGACRAARGCVLTPTRDVRVAARFVKR